MKAAIRSNRTILAQFPVVYPDNLFLSNRLFASIMDSARRSAHAFCMRVRFPSAAGIALID